MKSLLTGVAAVALLSWSIPASAQFYPAPVMPQGYYSGLWPEMLDNGSSSDFPTHTPSDFVADQLNRQVREFNAMSPPYR